MSKISVVICTYNRSDLLNKALNSLVKQEFSRDLFDILVVDNNSSDSTKDVVSFFAKLYDVKYFSEKNQGLSFARNRGIKESNSEYVCFMDDDAIAEKNWLEVAYNIISKEKPEIFGGPIYPFYENIKPKWFLDKYEIRTKGDVSRSLNDNEMLFGSNIFFKKEIFKKTGFFDVELGMKGDKIALGEETKLQVIAIQNKIERYYEPRLIVRHFTGPKKTTLKYIIKRNFLSSFYLRKIYEKEDIGLLRDVYYYIRELIKFLFLSIFLPIRNRKKYPYWQNYFIEKMFPNFIGIGKLYSYFKY